MKIEVKTKDCVYITINGTVYYIDDSTGEKIMKKWKEKRGWYDEVQEYCNKDSLLWRIGWIG